MTSRGIAPVIGVVVLVGMTVVLAGLILVYAPTALSGETPQASIGGSIDTETYSVTLEHTGGDPMNIEDIDLQILVDGEAITHQPPVPYFAASGFKGGPSGPFNPATSNEWAAGERGTLQLAETNDPLPTEASQVTVRVLVDDTVVAKTDLEHER